MPINQDDFEEITKQFSEIEDFRSQMWQRARDLLQAGYDIEAFILVLATWNFAGFRYLMKKMDLQKFEETLNNLNHLFARLEQFTMQTIDLNNNEIRNTIKKIYGDLKDFAKQTGASKIMALKNPGLFPMWDTEIRREYGIPNRGTPEDYIEYFEKLKFKFVDSIDWGKINRPIAKAIDEYNFVKSQNKKKKE
jgi:hypothetical protein